MMSDVGVVMSRYFIVEVERIGYHQDTNLLRVIAEARKSGT